MKLFMESTSIAVERTIADIEKCLSKYGVTAMLKEYTGGEIESLSFKIKRGQVDIPIQLPCRWIAIFEFLRKRSRMSDWSLANDRSPTNQKRIKSSTESSSGCVAASVPMGSSSACDGRYGDGNCR